MGSFVEELNRTGNAPVDYEIKYADCAKVAQREETVSEKVGNYLSGSIAMLEVVNCIENKLGITLPEPCSNQTTPSGIIEALTDAEKNMHTVWDKLNRICNIL